MDDSSSSSSSGGSSAGGELDQYTINIEEGQAGYCTSRLAAPVEFEHEGFKGSGYANTKNAVGYGLTWQISVESAGTADFNVRFANGGDSSRQGSLSVNGGADGVYKIQLPSTASWSAWGDASLSIQLQQGVNELSLRSDTADGLPNVDSISISGIEGRAEECETAPEDVDQDQTTLAFPGAMGFGRFATGGREGEVVHVTNLNDSGPGSLRDAISKANRIVVFDVGGVIKINSRLVFLENQTIAGQTAPGDGITIYGNGAAFTNAHNAIVRYIRFRMGRGGSSNKDAVSIARGSDFIFDHCSLTWGRDGTLDVSPDSGYTISNFTIQNSIVGQGLQSHSTGGLMTVEGGGASIIRSLYIDNHTRNPKARGVVQFINNVVYHWAVAGYILGDSAGDADTRYDGALVGNMFISGPETSGAVMKSASKVYHLFAQDNWYDPDKDGTLNPFVLNRESYGDVTWYDTPPINYPEVPTMAGPEALKFVIANVGVSKNRDEVDQFLIDELQSWGVLGQTISDEASLGIPNIVGDITGGLAPIDTDRDGMPDDWENQSGLDPNNPVDAMQDSDGDGWVNVEEYINSLTPLY